MRRVWLASTVVATVLVSGTAVASAATPSIPRGRLGLGDSIMLSAADELAERGMAVEAKVGRQFDEGLRLAEQLEEDGTLPKRVVVHLGTNGWVEPADCEALILAAEPARRVFLVTVRVPRSWMDPNNAVLRACAASHEQAHVIRWAKVSGRHPEWFADDGYHLIALGRKRYAAYVDRRVDRILASVRSAG